MSRGAALSCAAGLLLLAVSFPPSAHSDPLPRNRGFVTIGEIFRRSCAGCHAWAASYKGIAQPARISALSPEESLLYRQITDGSMPPSGPALSPGDVALIGAWIAARAPSSDSPLVDNPAASPYPSASKSEPIPAAQPCPCGAE
ncbi:MAG TPA: cytochrome c [Spirochaetia bacterium]|nr:cytochrome c [Spirochaetia bacterium]